MMKVVSTIAICIAMPFCMPDMARAQDVVKDTLELSKSFHSKPASIIEGKLSGVQVSSSNGSVNGESFVYIRGLNSLRSDSQPCWIVDGTPAIGVPDINPYDIESIEVLKDISATALYGFKGANGVIIINTKRKKQDGLKVDWHSNVAISAATGDVEESRVALSHNHSVNLSSVNGQSVFNLSGFWRTDNDVLKKNGNNSGSVSVLYETRANPVVWFSTNTILSTGGSSSTSGDFRLGEPAFLYHDYDNDMNQWRIFNTSSLSLNITRTFSLNFNFGADYKNNSNFIWFGNGTERGSASNGEAIIRSTSFLRFNVDPSLNWYRFVGKGKLNISAGASVNGDYDRTNVMQGTDFFSHELRARGLNIHASKSVVNNQAIKYLSYGAYLKGGYSLGEQAGFDAMIRSDKTPEFDDSPTLNYAANAFWKPFDYLKISAGYGAGGFEQAAGAGKFGLFVTGMLPVIDPELSYYYKGLNRVRSSEFNAGAALSLMGGGLNLSAKFYSKRSDDTFNVYCFGRKTSDSYLWRYSKRSDFFDTESSFRTKGIEIDARTVLISKDGIDWTAGLNFTWSDNELTEVTASDSYGQNLGYGLRVNKNAAGSPIASFFNSDGFVGNPFPKILGGLVSTLKLKGFTAEVEMNGAALFDVVDLSSVNIPLSLLTGIDQDCVRKGDFVKLGRLSLAWDLRPASIPYIRNMQISLSGYNLLLFSADSKKNPLLNRFGANGSTSGIAYGSFPLARSVVAGISMTF